MAMLIIKAVLEDKVKSVVLPLTTLLGLRQRVSAGMRCQLGEKINSKRKQHQQQQQEQQR